MQQSSKERPAPAKRQKPDRRCALCPAVRQTKNEFFLLTQRLNISGLEPLFMKTYFYHNLIFYFCTKFYACWRMYKKIHKKWKIYLIFIFIVCMFSFSCRRCSSVVEHVIGNDGVASPILARGTIFRNAPFEVLFCYENQDFQLVRFLRFLR